MPSYDEWRATEPEYFDDERRWDWFDDADDAARFEEQQIDLDREDDTEEAA